MAVSTVATPTVEIAFASSPLATAPTWVDVTSEVRRFNFSRGRSTELDRSVPGTATVVLNNRARKFDPMYTAGPYYGNLVPRKQIRIRATWNGTTYDLFRGFVQGWPQEYVPGRNGVDATVTIQCVDALGFLGGTNLPDDYFTQYVNSLSPANWWRLGDPTNGFTCKVTGTKLTSASGITWTPGSSLEPYLSSQSTVFDGTKALYGPCAASGTTVTVCYFVNITSSSNRETILHTASAGTTIWKCEKGVVGLSDADIFQAYNASGPYIINGADNGVQPIVADGTAYFVAFTSDGTSGNTSTTYVNGVSKSTTTATATQALTANRIAIGYKAAATPVGAAAQYPFIGSLQDVVIFNSLLNSTQVGLLYNAAVNPANGEVLSDRITRVLDAVSWPSAFRDLNTSDVTVGPAVYDGQPVGNYLSRLEDTEQGIIFASRDGKITFRNRWNALVNTTGKTSQATFSDDGLDNAYVNISFDYGSIGTIINDVTVSMISGTSQRYTDSTSVAAYGQQSATITSLLNDSDYALSLAQIKVGRYKDPQLRVLPFTVRPQRNPSQIWPAVLGLELGYRITAQRTPQNVGTQISKELILEGIAHSFDASTQTWEVTLSGSPVNTRNYWVLGTSGLGSADPNPTTRLGY